ncbi:MAG: Fic family protein, partial [Phycisphaerae bacterium]
LHHPPPAKDLPGRLEAMCDFANGRAPEGFVHPVVRSILLHYWLAYDHPFKDGNGRTARALFYWSMLQHDYWLCQFVSISQIIVNAPARYVRSFLYCETDDNDLTYFILHQLDIIRRAIDEFHRFIDRRLKESEQLQTRLLAGSSLNHRQLELMGHALRHPDAWYDIRQHQRDHGVVYETARSDLLDLEAKGLLIKHKRGRTLYFRPHHHLDGALKAL